MMPEQKFVTKCLDATDPEHENEPCRTAAQWIQQGEVVGMPTETVYGLGADATNEEAVAKIFAAKGRPQDNPLIVHICDIEMLEGIVQQVPPKAYRLFDAFWPGPLTVIMPRGDKIPAMVSAGLDTVAVRFPSHRVAQKIICFSGCPIAAPSANRSGSPSPTTAAHVMHDLAGQIPLVVNGGSAFCGVESTVITLCAQTPRLLRPGFVTVEELEEVLGGIEVDDAVLHRLKEGVKVSSPGMKYKHYAPKAELTLLSGDCSAQKLEQIAREMHCDGLLTFEEDLPQVLLPAVAYGCAQDSASQAACLFDALRQLDAQGFTKVLGRMPAQSGVGLAVTNRLLRAAAFRVIAVDDGSTQASI